MGRILKNNLHLHNSEDPAALRPVCSRRSIPHALPASCRPLTFSPPGGCPAPMPRPYGRPLPTAAATGPAARASGAAGWGFSGSGLEPRRSVLSRSSCMAWKAPATPTMHAGCWPWSSAVGGGGSDAFSRLQRPAQSPGRYIARPIPPI